MTTASRTSFQNRNSGYLNHLFLLYYVKYLPVRQNEADMNCVKVKRKNEMFIVIVVTCVMGSNYKDSVKTQYLLEYIFSVSSQYRSMCSILISCIM